MASVTVDNAKRQLERDAHYAQERHYRADSGRAAAEKAFINAVKEAGEALHELTVARDHLTAFEKLLCPACGCHNDDHTDKPLPGDARTGGWLCYDCGREEACR